MISLTQEQEGALALNENVYLSACPGSGKTRVILAKLLLRAEELAHTPRRVCCITYTNAAVDEIEQRLKLYGTSELISLVSVSTIHSFCLNNVVKPYRWLIPEIPPDFRILTAEMLEFEQIVQAVEDEIGRRYSARTKDDYSSIFLDEIGNVTGPGIVTGAVTQKTGKRFYDFVLARGFLDFALILYFAYRILDKFAFVAEGLACRFAWFLVDEFQDTNDIQIGIFRALHQRTRSKFFLVGDENQSIYGFSGAKPASANTFAHDIGANQTRQLSGNFRCGVQIIRKAELLLPRSPKMTACGDALGFNEIPKVVHSRNPTDAVINKFLPWIKQLDIPLGKSAILAPWWTHLVPIAKSLRNLGIPVVGPGARPYQRKRTFAVLAEQLGAAVGSGDLLSIQDIERAVFRLALEFGHLRFDIFSYAGRCTSLKLIYAAREAFDLNASGKEWLQRVSLEAERILLSDSWLPEAAAGCLTFSVQQMLTDMNQRAVDVDALTVADIGIFANPTEAIQLITLHNAKGREFDAVAMVCMNEGSMPHFTAQSKAEIDEARRVFYVGLTRARKALLISSDQAHYKNVPSRFIAAC